MFAPSKLNELTDGFEASLADDLDQYPLSPTPVELAVEDLLPRAEVELAARDRHHHLTADHLELSPAQEPGARYRHRRCPRRYGCQRQYRETSSCGASFSSQRS